MGKSSTGRYRLGNRDLDLETLLFGAALVDRKVLDEKGLDALLEEYAASEDASGKPFHAFASERGLVSEETAREILAPFHGLTAQARKKRLFGRRPFGLVALRIGCLTPAQLAELLTRQHALGRQGKRPPPLGQLALGLNMLSEADIEKILEAQRGWIHRHVRHSFQFIQKHKELTRIGVSLGVAAVVILLVHTVFFRLPDSTPLKQYLQRVEWMLYDLRFQVRGDRQPAGDVVILDVDQRSMQRFGNRWPVTRAVMGEVVRRLTEAQVKAIGWDVLFTSPDNPEEIEAMKSLVEQYRRTGRCGQETPKEPATGASPGEGSTEGASAGEDPFCPVLTRTYGQIQHDQMFADALRDAQNKGIWIIAAMYFIPEALRETASTYGDLDTDLFGSSEFLVARLLDKRKQKVVSQSIRDSVQVIDVYQPSMSGVLGTIEPISKAVQMQGFVNALEDPDGVLRSVWTAIPFRLGTEADAVHAFYPAMSLQTAWAYLVGDQGGNLDVIWTIIPYPDGKNVAVARDVKVGDHVPDLTELGCGLVNFFGTGNWLEYPEVTVIGAVSSPGTYELSLDLADVPSLTGLLRMARVRQPAADLCYIRRVQMGTKGEDTEAVDRWSLDWGAPATAQKQHWFRPGDLVYVPGPVAGGRVHVDGEVSQPGSFPVPAEGLPASKALELAGGWKKHATIDVRRSCVIRPTEGAPTPFLAIPVFESGRLSDQITVQAGDYLVFPRAYHRGRLMNYYSFVDVLDRKVNYAELRGKAVVVGSTSRELNDFKNSPFGILPGLEIQATYCQNVIDNNFMKRRGLETIDRWAVVLLVATVALLMGLLPQGSALALSLLVAAGYFAFAYYRFAVHREWYNLTAPGVGILGVVGLMTVYRFFTEQREKRKVRGMFSAMVSPDVLKYLEESPDRFRLTGEKKSATMFFSDVAGFTTISETLSAEALAMVLNRYLTPMSDIILSYGGYVDKYEGDAIMADFGVPIWSDPDPNSHAWKCCWAALDQQAKLQEIRKEIRDEFGVAIDVRMGINTGDVSAGNMGSAQKMQYTVMGDAVNQAARFEPANKPFHTHIMIGEKTCLMAKDRIEVRFLALMIVKGKTEPVKCYELLAKKGELSPEKRKVVDLFEEGWRLHTERRWDDAVAKFDEALRIDPEDGPSQVYRQICVDYKRQSPNPGWKGEWVQTTK